MLLKRGIGYVALIFAIVIASPYAFVDLLLLYSMLFGLATYAMLATAWPAMRRWRATGTVRKTATVVSAVVLMLWLTSIVAYVRVPFATGKALAAGNGSLILHSGVGIDGKPLTFRARWFWSGPTAGEFSKSLASFSPGVTANSHRHAIWPMLVALLIPTTILWFLAPRRIRPGHCAHCGYDLTGNTSGRCPECGEAVRGEAADGSGD